MLVLLRPLPSADPDRLVVAANAQVHALDPSRPVYYVRSLDQIVTRRLAPRRLQMVLMGGFAALKQQ